MRLRVQVGRLQTPPAACRYKRTVSAVTATWVVPARYVANKLVVQLALRTPTVCGSRSITRRSSAFHSGVTVGARPGAVWGGRAASPPWRKRLSTRSTVSRLRKTMAAISATERLGWARRMMWARSRSLALVVVSYNWRSSITWVSDKGGRVRGLAIVPFRKEGHHHTTLLVVHPVKTLYFHRCLGA